MNYRYYKSDFAIVMTIKAKYIGGSDGQMPITTAYPFTFRFFIKGKQSQGEYVASFDGENTTNCQILDEKSVIVYFDRTILELGIGELMVETSHDITDAHFEGDDVQNVKRFYSTNVTLTDKPDLDYDEEESIDIALLPLIIKGASGDAATQEMLDRAEEAIQNANDAADGLATQITNIENYCIQVNKKSEEAKTAANTANKNATSALERVSRFTVEYDAKLLTKYEKPLGGIPLADLSQDVKEAIQNAGKADGTTIVKNADNTLSVKNGVFATKEDIAEFEIKANNAEQSATAAQDSAQQAATHLLQIEQEIAEMEADPDTDAALVAKVAHNTAGLNDLARKMGKETNNVELVLDNAAYYVIDNTLRVGPISGYKSSNFTNSSGVGEPVKMKSGDTLYVKAQSQFNVGNNTVFITSTGGASIGKQVKSILTSEQTKNGFTFVATEDCDVFINNYNELEPSPIIHLTTYNIPFANKEYVDNELLKKQNELKSGINIKTVNGESILGNGNIDIKLEDGHWEDTDYTDKLVQRGLYYINYNGNLHANTNDNYFSSPAKIPQFGNDVIVVHPGEKIYIKAAIKAIDSFPTSVIFTSVTETFVLNAKPVLKSFGATEAIKGIEWTSDGDYEVYVNNDLSVCADPIIKISKWITKEDYATTDYVNLAKQEAINEANNYTNNQLAAFVGGFNPFKGKKMCIIGASNTGGLNANPNYPSYAKRTCELLNMMLIDKAQQPRFYSCGGKCYKLQAEDGTVVYTDFSPLEIANAEGKYYHFQTERGSWDSNGWSFVGVSDNVVTLKKNGTNKTFTYTSSAPLEGMFHIGIASTVAEINATNPAMVNQSYEKFLLDDSIDVLLFGLQAIEVSAWGGENTEVVSLMRRPTRTASAGDECHFTYADSVPLEDRRYCDSGALIYLIDRVLNANPKCRIILAQDGWGLNDNAKAEYGIMGLQMIVDRYKSMDMMALKFGFQVVNHWSKTGFSYINETEYFNSDRAHLNDNGMKLVGEIFAGELLAGTQDAVLEVVMNMLP